MRHSREPLSLSILAVAVWAYAFTLMGCALDAGLRTALYRDAPAAPHPGRSREAPVSWPIGARFVPRRDGGPTVGGEAEIALCHEESSCSPHIDVRNTSLLVGYSWLPPKDGGRRPGGDLVAAFGLGKPAGTLHPGDCTPAPCDGTRYRLGADATLAFPLVPYDTTRGFVVGTVMVDLLATLRGGVWSPPQWHQGQLLAEATLGFGVRVRAISDLLSSEGYPPPMRSQ